MTNSSPVGTPTDTVRQTLEGMDRIIPGHLQMDTDWHSPQTDLEHLRAALDECARQFERNLRLMQRLESIAAWLIRRATSVVRLATRLKRG